MCYDIVRSITIQEGKVFLDSTHRDLGSTSFQEQEYPELTAAYQKGGLHAALIELGRKVFDGTLVFQPQNCLLGEYIRLAASLIQPPLSFFLDAEHVGEFIATVAEGLYTNPMYSYAEQLQKLELLRSNPEATLELCKSNPRAFNFSESNVRRDRALAKRYILQCVSHPRFVFPSFFVDDIELAMVALRLDGRIFCQLGKNLRNNKQVAHFAYCCVPNRAFHATDAAYLGKDLLVDPDFLISLFACCPDLDVNQTTFILQNSTVARAWLTHNKDALNQLHLLPKEALQHNEVVSVLYELAIHDKALLSKVARLVFQAQKPEETPQENLTLTHLDTANS